MDEVPLWKRILGAMFGGESYDSRHGYPLMRQPMSVWYVLLAILIVAGVSALGWFWPR